MIKRLMYVALAFAVALGLFGQVDEANAKKKIGKCTIVIDAKQNYYKTGNLATPTGHKGCKDLKDRGYYGKYQEEGFFVGAKKVKNGEKIVVSNPLGLEFDEYIIEVITNNQGSQQSQSTSNQTSQPKQNNTTQSKQISQPKQNNTTKSNQTSQPKQSNTTQSKQTSQPKQSNTTQSKQTSQPKQNNTTQSKQISQPKQNNTTVKQTTNQVAQNTQKEETKTLQDKGDEQEKNEKENDKDKKDEKLSVDELKDKNAKVVKENGKFYASYKDEKGKDVKQEIAEEEAKELGYEADPIEKEPIKETEMGAAAVGNDNNNNASGKGLAIGAVSVLAAGLLGGTYYYFRKRIA